MERFSRRPQARPSLRLRSSLVARGAAERLRRILVGTLDEARCGVRQTFAGPRLRLRSIQLLAALAVAAVVLALPFGALPTQVSGARAAVSVGGDSESSSELFASQRGALQQLRVPLTVTREGPPQVATHRVQDGETLLVIAARFRVRAETIGYNNNITDPGAIHVGDELRVPPIDAAIHTVQTGETVEGVAAKYRVDPKVIMETNRLYFESENFAPGKTVLVPVADGAYPDFQLRPSAPRRVEVVARRATGVPAGSGARRLAWPVAGIISQYFWYGHQGVDIAAPYGSGIGAADAGTVTEVGSVPVGGLRVCVQHDWGMKTCYYHSSATYVSVGQRVAKGQIVAAIGLTGVTTGPHVHWEAKLNGVLVNPLAY